MAVKRKANRTTAVTRGWVKITVLNKATKVKAPFWSQILRRRLGQRLPKPNPLPVGSRRAPLCSQSPGAGIGQILHQPRPNSGTATNISKAHQAIQTKMIPKFRLPTGVPHNPDAIAKPKPARAVMTSRNCGHRLRRRALRNGIRVRS
jgi:hypothetical protein